MGNWFELQDSTQMNLSEDYINEIIEELGIITNGKVKGAFKEIKYTKAGYHTAIAVIQEQFDKNNKLFDRLFHRAEEDDKIVEESDEISGKMDINITNGLKVYKFEIYNDCYHFRIFKLVKSLAYPVGIVLDEGIADELGMKNPGREIDSNADMERFLHRIISTQKVRNVINQMIILVDTESDEVIKDYILNHGGATIKEIASGIGWTQKITKERVKKLEEEGLIFFDKDKKGYFKYVTPQKRTD